MPARSCDEPQGHEADAILLEVAPVKMMVTGLLAVSKKGTTVTSVPERTGSFLRAANCRAPGRRTRTGSSYAHGRCVCVCVGGGGWLTGLSC